MSNWVKLSNSFLESYSVAGTAFASDNLITEGYVMLAKEENGDWHPVDHFNEKYLWLLPPIKDCGESEDRARYDDWCVRYEFLKRELYYQPMLNQDLEEIAPEPEDHYIKKKGQWTLKWEYAQGKLLDYLHEEELYLEDLLADAEKKKNDLQVQLLQSTVSEDMDLASTLASLTLPRQEEILRHCQSTLTRVRTALTYCSDFESTADTLPHLTVTE